MKLENRLPISKQHLTDLRDVSDILKDMAGELDTKTHVCNSCGRDSWTDLQEGRLGSEVGAMLRKANKCIGIVKDSLR